MSHEIVKYKNDLNKFSFSGLTETELDVIFAIFHKFKEKGQTEIFFQTDELKELIEYTRKDISFDKYAFKTFSKIQSFKIECRNPVNKVELLSVVVFPIITLNEKERYVKVTISPIIADYLNAIENNFTRFELAEFVNLQSGYAKTLYRLLKQFRSTGWAQFEWTEFLRLMGVPKTYLMQNIDMRVLKSSVKELQKPQDLFDSKRQPFTNLKYEKIKAKGRGRGGKVIGIKFTFDPISDPSDVPADFQLEPQTMADIERLNQSN